METFEDWALTAAVFVPLLGAVLMALIPRDAEGTIKGVALLTTVVTAAVGLGITLGYTLGDARWGEVNESWISVINSRYHIFIDGISLPLLLLSMAICVLCVIYSWDHFPEPHNPKAFLMLLLVLETGMNGTFVAQDLILFFVFFELVLLPMYFMIGVCGGENRQYASIYIFLYSLFGAALMFLGYFALYFMSR